jgi:hypothetical protein
MQIFMLLVRTKTFLTHSYSFFVNINHLLGKNTRLTLSHTLMSMLITLAGQKHFILINFNINNPWTSGN